MTDKTPWSERIREAQEWVQAGINTVQVRERGEDRTELAERHERIAATIFEALSLLEQVHNREA